MRVISLSPGDAFQRVIAKIEECISIIAVEFVLLFSNMVTYDEKIGISNAMSHRSTVKTLILKGRKGAKFNAFVRQNTSSV